MPKADLNARRPATCMLLLARGAMYHSAKIDPGVRYPQ